MATSHWAALYNTIQNMRPHPIKLAWRELPGNKLQAYVDPEGTVSLWGLREEDMDPVQQWSAETNCGTRMSFDMWKFKSKKHITMFLMKWAS
jgi:hypothetical protein